MTYFFLELLIFFWLTLVDIWCLQFISNHTKERLYVNTNFIGNQSWNKNKYFHLFSDIDVEKNCSLNVKLKTPDEYFLVFLSFMSKHIFRRRPSQMFFKIGPLKNFAIFWIKERLRHRWFHICPVNPLMPGGNKNVTHTCLFKHVWPFCYN